MIDIMQQTKDRAEVLGEFEALKGLPRDSKALPGSLWDVYYNIGYDSEIGCNDE